MKLQEFISQHNNQFLDFDGIYGAQCVDVSKAWNAALGYSARHGNGIDWINLAGSDYDKILYAPGRTPQEGDIFSMGAMPNNPYGHTGVVIAATNTGFSSFDQNWPPGSPCHVQTHNYQYMQGWIRPKTYQGGETTMIPKQFLAPNNGDGRPTFLYKYPGDTTVRYAIPNPDAFNAGGFGQVPIEEVPFPENPDQTNQMNALNTQLSGANDMIAKLQKQIASGSTTAPVNMSIGDLIRLLIKKITGGDN